jgi:hypothetical protein
MSGRARSSDTQIVSDGVAVDRNPVRVPCYHEIVPDPVPVTRAVAAHQELARRAETTADHQVVADARTADVVAVRRRRAAQAVDSKVVTDRAARDRDADRIPSDEVVPNRGA